MTPSRQTQTISGAGRKAQPGSRWCFEGCIYAQSWGKCLEGVQGHLPPDQVTVLEELNVQQDLRARSLLQGSV